MKRAPKNHTVEEMLALADREHAAAMVPAKEALEQVYRAILSIPEFSLKDGTSMRVRKLIAPELNAEGDLQCGFDLEVGHGDGHLEFMVKNTGWGRSLASKVNKERAEQKKGRSLL